METVNVSVVVPVYNSEKYLEECLDSILGQTLEKVEIICVDDGSEDCSPIILKTYAEHYDNFQIITQDNKYAGVARNNGMELAHGEYIIFLDADDTFEPTMLQCMYDKIKTTSSDICLCGARTFDNNTGRTFANKEFLKSIPDADPFSWKDIPDSIYDITTPSLWNMLFRTSFLKKNKLRFEDCKRANDLRFFGCSLPMADRITTVKDVLVNYRFGHNTSLQATHNGECLTEYNSLKQIRSYLKENDIFYQVDKGFYKLCVKNLNYVLKRKDEIDYNTLISHMKNDEDALFSLQTLKEEFGEEDELFLMMQSHFSSPEKENNELLIYENRDRISVQFSVIVTVFNDEVYVDECLSSLENQTFKDFEIIIVNDGSSDNTEQICRNFVDHTSAQVIYISKPNGGVSSARNCGLKYVKGDYIKFLDGDDYYTSDALECCLSSIKQEDAEVLITNIEAYPDVEDDLLLENKVKVFNNDYIRKHNYVLPSDGKELFVRMSIQNEFLVSMGTFTFKREFIENNNLRFVENIYHEDDYFAIEVMFKAKIVKYCNNTIYMRRVRHGSIMTAKDNSIEKGRSRLFIAERIFSNYLEEAMEYDDSRLLFCLDKFINRQINMAMNLLFPKPSSKKFKKYIFPYSINNPKFYNKLAYRYDSRTEIIGYKMKVKKMESSRAWRYSEPFRAIRRLVNRKNKK